MFRTVGLVIVAAAALACRAGAQQSSSAMLAIDELKGLEARWNDAHTKGDTVELLRQWADDITFVVPEMRRFSKDDVMAFWRSGRARLMRHETSDVTYRTYGDAAVVEGRLHRQRNFNGQVIDDDWRFTKTYVRRDGRWLVVSYHASVVPPPR